MPELPEVETVVRSLRPLVVGKRFADLEVRKEKSFPYLERRDKIIGILITALTRRAKIIKFQFENDWQMLVHLKMTGQLLYDEKGSLAGGGHPTSDVLKQLPGKHTRLVFSLAEGGKLFFNDMRIFGWAKVLTATEAEKELEKFGPDINEKLNPDYLAGQLARRSQKIKQVIMDNSVMAGIGNIYAAETLFASGISPTRPAKSLTAEEIEVLAKNIYEIINDAIVHRGTTFDGRYVDAEGKKGNYVEKLQVYGREGEACRRCGTTLQNIKIGGRATVFCPKCQK